MALSESGDEHSNGTSAAHGDANPLFRPTAFLEREVARSGVQDGHVCSYVAEQMQARQEGAEQEDMRHRSSSNTDRLKRVAEARRAVKANNEDSTKAVLKSRHTERLGAAILRRKRSLDNIKAARQLYHRRVAKARMDAELAAAGFHEECRRPRDSRRRRCSLSAERFERARAHLASRQQQRQRQQQQRSGGSGAEADDNEEGALSQHARVIQAWWRYVRCCGGGGGSGGSRSASPVPGPRALLLLRDLSSPGSTATAASLNADERCCHMDYGAFFQEDMESPAAAAAGLLSGAAEAAAGARIVAFARRRLHDLRVRRGLLACRGQILQVAEALRAMTARHPATGAPPTFASASAALRAPGLAAAADALLRALRMGRAMRGVPPCARNARAFLTALLIHAAPVEALDAPPPPEIVTRDGAVVPATQPVNTELQAQLRLERAALLRVADAVASAVLELAAAAETAAAAAAAGRAALAAAAARLARSRVAFCACLESWKRLDAERLAEEMEAAMVDILLVQLRAERDLSVAARRLGLDADAAYAAAAAGSDGSEPEPVLATGYRQIREGAARHVARMASALLRLIGPHAAHARVERAAAAAAAAFAAAAAPAPPSAAAAASAVAAAAAGGGGSGGGEVRCDGGGSGCGSGMVEVAEPAEVTMHSAQQPAAVARPLSAGDLLGNDWLVHEIMVAEGMVQVTLDDALENGLLDHSIAGTSALFRGGASVFWARAGAAFERGDFTPLFGIVAALRDRITGLTPRRGDLAEETAGAMDVELLAQMAAHQALDPSALFRLIGFAGNRVLELEAPVHNAGTEATLREWAATAAAVEAGQRSVDVAFVRSALEYLLAKTDEIHVDIINAHLQYVVPFLRQHGVEHERDRFAERLEEDEVTLSRTHHWLERAIQRVRREASGSAPEAPAAVALLAGLAAAHGGAYLELLRRGMVDDLLGVIVRADAATQGDAAFDGFVPVPETLEQDQARLVDIAAGIEQAAYVAALSAIAKQLLGASRVAVAAADEEALRDALGALFAASDASSADIAAQVLQSCRAVAARVGRPLCPQHCALLSSRAAAVLGGACPVYRLYLRRALAALRELLVAGGATDAAAFAAALARRGLGAQAPLLTQRVARPLLRIQRHSEAVFAPYYNEMVPLALGGSAAAAAAAAAAAGGAAAGGGSGPQLLSAGVAMILD